MLSFAGLLACRLAFGVSLMLLRQLTTVPWVVHIGCCKPDAGWTCTCLRCQLDRLQSVAPVAHTHAHAYAHQSDAPLLVQVASPEDKPAAKDVLELRAQLLGQASGCLDRLLLHWRLCGLLFHCWDKGCWRVFTACRWPVSLFSDRGCCG